jgi:DNA-binding CsgD family transcriptional regulator
MNKPEEKKRRFNPRSVYTQIFAMALAFAALVFIGIRFMGDIMNGHMANSIEAAFDNTEANIAADLKEMETLLEYISETVRLMILAGLDFGTVSEYITGITGYMMSDDERFKEYATGVYGIFDVFDGRFHDGTGWIPPDGFVPAERPWHKAAVAANGRIGITEPYVSIAFNIPQTMTFSRRIDSEDGTPLGIVCLDILLDRVRSYAVNTNFTRGGYGLLLNKQIEILTHPDSAIWGRALRGIDPGYAAIADDLEQGVPVTGRRARNHNKDACVVSFRQLENGWHVGMVILEKTYYKEMRRMRLILIAVGAALAALFSAMLLWLSKARGELEHIKEEHGLTAREREIFAMLLLGKEPKDIGFALEIGYSTVNLHIRNLLAKLGVRSRAELLVRYQQRPAAQKG